jgi:tetratricopeptide (TPR) repeat protein
MVSYLLAPRFEDMLREIAAGNPVIVLWNQAPVGTWHYAVAVGYDYEKGKLILRSGGTERQAVPFAIHELLWMRSGYWAMVAVPPDRIPVTAVEPQWLSSVAAVERSDAPAARTAYQTFMKRWPDNTNAAVGLANTYYTLGELKQAEGVLRKAAAHDPGSEIVLNNLAQTLSDQNRDDEALPIIDKAAALRGPHADAVEQTRKAILGRIAAGRKN